MTEWWHQPTPPTGFTAHAASAYLRVDCVRRWTAAHLQHSLLWRAGRLALRIDLDGRSRARMRLWDDVLATPARLAAREYLGPDALRAARLARATRRHRLAASRRRQYALCARCVVEPRSVPI